MKKLIIVICLFALGAGGAYGFLYFKRHSSKNIPIKVEEKSKAPACDTHELTACPFCDKSQIEKQGECKAHKVPEALCSICRPDLVAAFKIENDWCEGHKVPESQCKICGGEAEAEEDSDALCKEHKVPAGACPFCDKSLIEKWGMCGGHKVPEALCSRCNKDLIPGFKAIGDWCEGHKVPESQCTICGAGK